MQEAQAVYGCLLGEMIDGYTKSGWKSAKLYKDWRKYNTGPYTSDTHGGRFVNNYANAQAQAAYAKYEDVGLVPVGSVMAKDSFVVSGDGKAGAGPLFLMEKMHSGFNPDTANWKYTLMMPTGAVFGTTGGEGADNVAFCHDCHVAVAEGQDHLFFLPEEYRVK